MNKETLKELIEIEFERSETISQFKDSVFRLIDLYDKDSLSISDPFPWVRTDSIPKDGKVPYWTKCSCNPSNGGSGICGCTMANKWVISN
jgi:hypothetical protein